MGFTVQQAATALQQSGGNLDIALNSLLPSDQPNGQPTPGSRESRTAASSVTSNGLSHRNDRTDTRSHHQPPDSSHNDRGGMYSIEYRNMIGCNYMWLVSRPHPLISPYFMAN